MPATSLTCAQRITNGNRTSTQLLAIRHGFDTRRRAGVPWAVPRVSVRRSSVAAGVLHGWHPLGGSAHNPPATERPWPYSPKEVGYAYAQIRSHGHPGPGPRRAFDHPD